MVLGAGWLVPIDVVLVVLIVAKCPMLGTFGDYQHLLYVNSQDSKNKSRCGYLSLSLRTNPCESMFLAEHVGG